MKIKLQSLEIKNFKGIDNKLINFGDITQIQGENGTGKSTIFDAFCWLMFGKDSHDRKVFGIQTLDSNNNIIHHLEHSVTGVLEIDGIQKIFKRTLNERWQKKRGSAEQELNGCSTDYEIDDIPVKQKEYLEKISEILEESSFKLLTNPLYFPSLEWKKQREILLNVIGDISEENVINYNSKLKPLLEILDGKSIDDFNKRVAASIKKLKDKVKDIPARIDENNNSICNEDFTELEKQKITLQNEINVIDEQIADSSKINEGKLKLQEELFTLKDKLGALRNDALKNANKPLNEVQEKIYKVGSKIKTIEFNIISNQSNIKGVFEYIKQVTNDLEYAKSKKDNLLKEYHAEKDKTFEFDITLTNCSCCGREYDMDKIEEIRLEAENLFNLNKDANLKNIISKGKPLAADIEGLEPKLTKSEKDIEIFKSEVIELEKQKTELETQLSELKYQKQKLDCVEPVIEGEKELVSQIEVIQGKISNFKTNNNNILILQKSELQGQISDIDKLLGKQQTNTDLKVRIQELNQEEKDLNIQIATLEGQQFLGEEFIRTKVELLESTINQKFKGEVQFKLFRNLINGGLEECCEALVLGVPFADANTASRMNAGISILNILCEHYGVDAPVFIDNSESINQMNHTNSQLIKLTVSLDKNLKVEVA